MHIRTASQSGEKHGYHDLYINEKGSCKPFKYIYEGSHRRVDIGELGDIIIKNRSESYQNQVTPDNVLESAGVMPAVRI